MLNGDLVKILKFSLFFVIGIDKGRKRGYNLSSER